VGSGGDAQPVARFAADILTAPNPNARGPDSPSGAKGCSQGRQALDEWMPQRGVL